MTKADNKRSSTVKTHRTAPYTIPSTRTDMHPRSATPETGGQLHNQANTSEPHSSTPWSPSSDEQLMRARQQGLNWAAIAETYFPLKTANACRKRHERLMEKRNAHGDWNGLKFEEVAKAYREVREEMWRILADRVNEKWSVVESKVCSGASKSYSDSQKLTLRQCMERGLKNLASMGRAASRKDRSSQHDQTHHDFHDDSGLVLDTHSGNEASAEDQHPFSAGSYSSRRTTLSNVSSGSFTPSLPRPTPSLPNFNQGFSTTSLPGISSIVGPSGLPVTTHC
ncbi:MAG: hypothetical protein L6R40_006980 [Gallowayella cf. fulva]|nr:MAG: hypothetical protein L6R40_006980 [Xanthomendoza cf. fulva]